MNMNAHNAKHAPVGFFDRRAAKKDAVRMAEYKDPKFAKGMEELFGGAINPPERGRMRF